VWFTRSPLGSQRVSLRVQRWTCSRRCMLSRFLLRVAALRGLRADVAALAFGALSAAALPPVHAIPVLLVSVPGLLALLDGARCPAVAARRGWWFGFGHHLFGLYWITEAILFE